MAWENWYLRFIVIVPLVAADLCPEPIIPNGVVKGEKEPNLFFGEITCNIGYHLVGASKNIKCRHGVWSQEELPVCAAIGACPSLPELANGRNVPMQGSRGSAYRFKCNRGFKRFGELRTHCVGDRWSHTHMPSCAKATCDETGMLDIPYGEGRAMMGGAVYKYRCYNGVEMEGSNTLVCDGDKWNGTVPHCNVKPDEPELEVIVSGKQKEVLKPGDWVLVTCQARGGHPVPEIGITVDGIPSGSKDFRNFKNSFTFEASEKDDGKRILCTAVNKAGASATSTILKVHTPPSNAIISGPKTIHHEDEFTYECTVKGGNPAPKITWTMLDHLGQTKKVNGEMLDRGVSRMVLKTGTKERMLTIMCLGENDQGIVSNTMNANTHYLPASVEVTGPTTAVSGEFAHFICLTTESFPVPTLKWRIERSGDKYEVSDIDGDVSTDVLKDGGVMAYAKIDVVIKKGDENVMVRCSAGVKGLGERSSDQHLITVSRLEDYVDDIKSMVNNESFDQTETDLLVEEEPNLKTIHSTTDKEADDMFEKVDATEETESTDNNSDKPTSSEIDQIVKQIINDEITEKKADIQEQERSRVLWIPLKAVDDIEDYQNLFTAPFRDESEEYDFEEEFFRPSDIPEATMLKQEKGKETVVYSPQSVPMVYSSSPTSTIPIQSVCLPMFLYLFIFYGL